MVMPAGKEVKANMIGKRKIEPMKKVMVVPFEKAPVGALDKYEIQEDKLIEGKLYKVSLATDRRKNNFKIETMKLIKCYPHHYLFEGDHSIKHSFSKVNHVIGELRIREA